MDDVQSGLALAIRSYRDLLANFVAGEMSADDFEQAYLSRYLANDEQYPQDVFVLVDAFFADVDAYVSDEHAIDRAEGDLDEADLRARASTLLASSEASDAFTEDRRE